MLHTCQGSSLQMHSQDISPLCPQTPGLSLCDSASESRHLKPWQKKKGPGEEWEETAVSSFQHQVQLLFSPEFQAPVNWQEFRLTADESSPCHSLSVLPSAVLCRQTAGS